MGSASAVFLVSLNLVFFTLVSSQTPPACPQNLGSCESALRAAFSWARPNPNSECCKQFQGLNDADAATCMCQILKANSSRIPADLDYVKRLFMTYCGRNPDVYTCA